MPVYSFACHTCFHEFENLQSFKDPMPPCPECGGSTWRTITYVPGVSLKGVGWSQDNYSVTDQGNAAVSDKADKGTRVVSFPGQKHKGRTGA